MDATAPVGRFGFPLPSLPLPLPFIFPLPDINHTARAGNSWPLPFLR